VDVGVGCWQAEVDDLRDPIRVTRNRVLGVLMVHRHILKPVTCHFYVEVHTDLRIYSYHCAAQQIIRLNGSNASRWLKQQNNMQKRHSARLFRHFCSESRADNGVLPSR
jgi:5-methylcytosine-specific restriction endonuclease McrBC regulatory subunit McrC